jgi:hypothetical protein
MEGKLELIQIMLRDFRFLVWRKLICYLKGEMMIYR